jgi:hypothetical protein
MAHYAVKTHDAIKRGVDAGESVPQTRFFTNDYRAELYSEFGLDYIRQATMVSLLKRHYPGAAPVLQGLENAFHSWKPVEP